MKRPFFSHTAVHVLLLLALGILAYGGTFDVPFFFDDRTNIVENSIVHDLHYFSAPEDARGLAKYEAMRTRYVGFLSFALNYWFDGLRVTGYHVINLGIHLLNAFLVYALVLLSFKTPILKESTLAKRSPWIALLTAALFVSHPLQTQAVTYIVQRLASLAALFYLGAMVAYIKARLSEKRQAQAIYYLLALVLAVLAMYTKEHTFTLPLAIAMYELFFFAGGPKKRALVLLPVLLTLLIIPLTLLGPEKPMTEALDVIEKHAPEEGLSSGQYLITQFRVIATYLRLLILPINQTLYYDYPVYHSLLQGPVLLALLVHLTLLGLGIFLYRKDRTELRLVSYGICFFYLALSMESGLIPLHPIYEHRMYLPAVGALMATAVVIMVLLDTIGKQAVRTALVIVLLSTVCVLTAATAARNTVWQTTLGFWQDAVRKAPNSSRARNSLGRSYLAEGMLDEAMEQLQAAVESDPENSEALINIGHILYRKGMVEESIMYFQEAIRHKPWIAHAYNNLGLAYLKLGRTQEAIKQFKAAVHLNPSLALPYANLGRSYYQLGMMQEARRQLQMALSLNGEDIASRRLLLQIENMR